MSDTPPKRTEALAVKDEFDIGPLMWVKSEMQFALTRADEGVSQFGAQPGDHDLIKTTLPHLHQVTGALRMIGLEPITLVSGAMEKVIEALSKGAVQPSRDVISALHGSIKALNRYIEGLVQGERHRPLALYQTYKALLAIAGSDSTSPIDLFFPDFSRTPEFVDGPSTRSGAALKSLLAAKRMEFQKSLLHLLRSPEYQQSFAHMYGVLSEIDAAQPSDRRLLWWIAVGFAEGLAKSPKPPGAFQKQLCGRLDQEIKRQADGGDKASERLLREVLFAIAYMTPDTPRVREIHAAYRLLHLLPPAAQESPETTRVKVLLADIQSQLEAVKETWLSVTTGSNAGLFQFANETAQLNNFAQSFNNKALRAIFAKLAEVGHNLMNNPRDPGEALGLEVATLLLRARDAMDNYSQLGPNFNTMTQTAVLRVNAAMKGRPLPGSGAQIVNMRRTAHERQLFSQLGQEITNNLNQIEETLDAFFRDPAKRVELTKLLSPIKQVQGALAILESRDAVNLMQAGSDLVRKFIGATGPADTKDAELTAEAFSHLGLFVLAIQQGYENTDEILKPALERLGIALTPK
ncbi:MAG TPA: hypothetical protein VM532_17465 [Burkholderiales bacterium]|nr:hypothetical protein [Burkholderiales bacterium]